MEEEEGRLLIRLTGPLTAPMVAETWKELTEAFRGAGPVVLDAGAVDDCDSLGLQLLYAALDREEGAGGASLSEISPVVRETADRAGLSLSRFLNTRQED